MGAPSDEIGTFKSCTPTVSVSTWPRLTRMSMTPAGSGATGTSSWSRGAAEELGFDGLTVTEHHAPMMTCPSPHLLLAVASPTAVAIPIRAMTPRDGLNQRGTG